MGHVSSSDLVNELLNSDLYVHPSHIENSPNAVQEAMLLGMPVIATKVGGTSSLLVDGHEGILVQNNDPYDLAGAILELMEFPENGRLLGINARKLGLKRNDPVTISEKLMTIMGSLVNSK